MRLICSFFLLIGSCASAGEKVRDLVMAGQTRHYREFIPADCAKKPCPVIFAFHGGGGDAAGAEKMFGFQDLGESAGFITVYPAGLSRNWNDGRGEVGATADDLGFFDLVYKDLAAHAQIDLKRVFATGISNGGMFSFRLACERSSVFAAVAPVAANMTKFLNEHCHPPVGISVFNIMGDQDPIIPFKGGQIKLPFHWARNRGEVLSSDESVLFWKGLDGCSGDASVARLEKDASDPTAVRKELWGNCKSGVAVSRWVIEGGGHTWPSGPQYLHERIVGKVSHRFSAAAEIWSFFREHAKK